MNQLTRAWRTVFWCEVVLCAVTCVAWTIAPGAFLNGVFDLDGADVRHRLLLLMTANVVVCAYVYLYARLLLDRPFAHLAFRRLQEAMAIGDVIMLATSAAEATWLRASPLMLGAQVAMAALWLALRLTWLWQTRPRTAASVPGAT